MCCLWRYMLFWQFHIIKPLENGKVNPSQSCLELWHRRFSCLFRGGEEEMFKSHNNRIVRVSVRKSSIYWAFVYSYNKDNRLVEINFWICLGSWSSYKEVITPDSTVGQVNILQILGLFQKPWPVHSSSRNKWNKPSWVYKNFLLKWNFKKRLKIKASAWDGQS